MKRASFVLWDNVSTTFSCQSPSFEINIKLADAGVYLFNETDNGFTISVAQPMRINGTVSVTVDRIGYGEGCTTSTDDNASTTNVTLTSPTSFQSMGASVNTTCKKQTIKNIPNK